MAHDNPIDQNNLADVEKAEKWFNERFNPSFTQEQILKLILFKLHKLEEQNTRMNSIL
jgi:hypothetical protein